MMIQEPKYQEEIYMRFTKLKDQDCKEVKTIEDFCFLYFYYRIYSLVKIKEVSMIALEIHTHAHVSFISLNVFENTSTCFLFSFQK